ncbi:FtsK/SpoIIIE domain-containing protein [Streptomyces sp. YIM 98790]|uniref:FtsK/SpoIIIE domain-containing protein n=1 Tax=Streptomyces sp. YIM 98790 TaxID=2689077 RepID=UPI00140BF068|nr:FtsK/SpoIIIE domain-containing protein [Streptomyces sp. YIM 98790]
MDVLNVVITLAGLCFLLWVLWGRDRFRVRPDVRWYLTGYLLMALRVVFTWKRVCQINDLSVSYRPNMRSIGGGFVVRGESLRVSAPRIGWPMPTRDGIRLRVRLRPGQTPGPFLQAGEAFGHAWRAHSVRVTSPARGWLEITATGGDPLGKGEPPAEGPGVLLRAEVGRMETGKRWVIDFKLIPHWLIVGATQSGKSTLMTRLVTELARQPVALLGIDCKGGMELSLFAPRLSALATNRSQAVALLETIVTEMGDRMGVCRQHGARSLWELPDSVRPVPLVVLVDEVAELYLTTGAKSEKEEAAACATAMLRIAQLGRALGVYLVVAGQRVGSDLGPGVTALRAQLGGRICHRVADPQTAVMTLGDLNPDAVAVAQAISPAEAGVAVTATETGGWVRARSWLTTAEDARGVAHQSAALVPWLPFLHLDDGRGGGEAA